MTASRFVILASIAVSICNGAIITNFSELKNGYDFVVVGGGTAGLVVANRLTENPNWSVLVIEAGGSHDDDITIQVPFFASKLSKSAYDWNFTSVPQSALNGRTLSVPRGFLLGGSSAINHMAYIRGSFEDWDNYAAVTEDEGWSWNEMYPYFLKNEKLTPPPDNHNTSGQINPSLHGTHGLLGDGLSGWPTPIDSRIISVTQELSSEFPYNEDIDNGRALGINWALRTVSGGARTTSSTGYLLPFVSRSNLDVLINTRVTRVLATQHSTTGYKPDLRTVEFAASANDARHNITASKEVILSGGAIGTPHILLHSGIGDSQALQPLGIKTVLNNPSVGQNLSDHSAASLTYLVNETDTFEVLTRNKTFLDNSLQQWQTSRTGPLTNTVGSQWAFLRIPSNNSIWQGHSDTASGPNSAHLELIPEDGLVSWSPPSTGHYLTISVINVSPISRGSLIINSSNPFDYPVIDPNLLSADIDVLVLREALKIARQFVAAPAWNGYIISPFNTNATSDEDLETFIRSAAGSAQHLAGTAMMSARNAKYGVVNPDLKVKGVTGLRVVDGSVFPRLITGHTQIPVYAVAERASDLIKATWAH